MSITLPRTQKPTKLNDAEVGEVADFVIKYGNGLYHPTHKPRIEAFIRQHVEYGTLMVVQKEGSIIGVCRWNFTDIDTICVMDLIIHPDYRKKWLMKSMLINGVLAFPWLKSMTFHRKKHNRDTKCLIKKFIGGK